jgi:hypothetical protein
MFHYSLDTETDIPNYSVVIDIHTMLRLIFFPSIFLLLFFSIWDFQNLSTEGISSPDQILLKFLAIHPVILQQITVKRVKWAVEKEVFTMIVLMVAMGGITGGII